MNWADFILGVGTGLFAFVTFLVAVIIFAIKNKQKIMAHGMKFMMKAGMKAAANAKTTGRTATRSS